MNKNKKAREDNNQSETVIKLLKVILYNSFNVI